MGTNWHASLPILAFADPPLELTPAELEEVTGLTPEMQRVWRSRGHLEKLTGTQARYTVRDAAQILIGYELSRWGLSPGRSMEIALKFASQVIQFALLNADGTCEVQGEKKDVEKFEKIFTNLRDSSLVDYLSGNEGNELVRCLVSWDHSEPEGSDQLPELEVVNGSISIQVLDIVQAGIRLAERVGRPLVKIEIGRKADWSRSATRRVIGGHER